MKLAIKILSITIIQLNPSAGKFTIDCLDATYNDVLYIEVVDVLGRVLYAQQRKANLGIVAINTHLLFLLIVDAHGLIHGMLFRE